MNEHGARSAKVPSGSVKRLPDNHEYLKPVFTAAAGKVVWPGGARIEPPEGQEGKRFIFRVGREEQTGKTFHVICEEIEPYGLVPMDDAPARKVRQRYWADLEMVLADIVGL